MQAYILKNVRIENYLKGMDKEVLKDSKYLSLAKKVTAYLTEEMTGNNMEDILAAIGVGVAVFLHSTAQAVKFDEDLMFKIVQEWLDFTRKNLARTQQSS